MTAIGEQLSLHVLPDPNVVPGGVFVGTLRVAGEFAVAVLSTALGMVVGVGFSNLMDKETVIGTERQHKARLA